MYKHILIPIALDHEHTADEALAVARRLLDEDGKMTALHVMDELPGFAKQYLPQGHMETRRAQMEAALAEAVGGADGIGTAIVQGQAGRSIVDWAEDHGVDLIVIASHRPGFGDYFLGSTAARVVRHAGAAVHVLR